jgi:hypothetical protein
LKDICPSKNKFLKAREKDSRDTKLKGAGKKARPK